MREKSGQIKEAFLPRALLTGFGPFPGVRENPSGTLAARICASPRWQRLGWTLDGLIFPTGYDVVSRLIAEEAERQSPGFVVMLGVAARAKWLRVERRAKNQVSMTYRDARGTRPPGLRLERSGEATRFGRHPGAPLVRLLRAHHVPARLSRDTGRYVCNAAYWRMLKAMPEETEVLFVHIPLPMRSGTRRRDSRPGMLAMERALMALVLAMVKRARVRVRR